MESVTPQPATRGRRVSLSSGRTEAETHLHLGVDGGDVAVPQPERSQAEHPGVVFSSFLQTLDVVLHRLTQEALLVRPQVGQGLFIQLQLFLHLYGVPEHQK